MDKIYHFKPFVKSIIWGGNEIARIKHLPVMVDSIGESWEISSVKGHESVIDSGSDSDKMLGHLIDTYKGDLVGEKVYKRFGNTFPLLIKIIDANDNLSIQVHPDDDLAQKRHGSFGKTEMWYIIKTRPGARIISGLAKQITKDDYRRMVADNTIMDALANHSSAPGDVFFLPAGRIHAIGAGNLLLEIQQTSDITYRVYDYDRVDAAGNRRALHTEEAADAIDYTVYPDYVTAYDKAHRGITRIVDCKYFSTDKVAVDGCITLPMPNDSFLTVSCVEGECILIADDEHTLLSAGCTVLVAANVSTVVASGHAILITSSIPD